MNPYLGYGAIVTGDRMVGRRTEFEQLEQRLSTGTGSISVIGEPRIGKSSLINAVSDRIRKTTAMPVAWIDTSTLPGSTELFCEITSEILAGAERNHCTIPPELARIVSTRPASSYDAYRQCRLCLTLLNRGGIKQVVVLDEFDAIRGFPDAAVTIQRLRDLIYRRFETGLAAVFVSRRTLRNIEQQLADVSTLDNVCEQFCVRPFDEGALWLLADRCRDEWQIVEQDKRQLVWYSGGHPYIAEMILCHALPTRSIRAGCDAVIASIFEYYQHLQRLLEEDGLFEQLLQIVVGPRWSIRPGSLELLQRYGIVRLTTTEPSRYEGWSQHFQLYLEKCARESVLWALWRDTESAIREHIQEVCERAYGQDWIETLVSRHGSVAKILGECRAKRKKEESNFGLAASLNVLDYSYPMDLWCILSCEWDLFRRIFQKEKRYWSDRFAHLSKVRTPTAHSREIVIPDHEVVLAQAYCKEILMLLRGGSQAEDVRADVAALD